MLDQAGIKIPKDDKKFRETFSAGIREHVRIMDLGDADREKISSVVEPLLDSGASISQIKKALFSSKVIEDVENSDPDTMFAKGFDAATDERTHRQLAEARKASQAGGPVRNQLQAVSTALRTNLGGKPENEQEFRRVQAEIQKITKTMRPNTVESSRAAGKQLQDLISSIADPAARVSAQAESDAAANLFTDALDDRGVTAKGDQRNSKMNPTDADAVLGDRQTRQGTALRMSVAEEGQRSFEAPTSLNKGGESPEISLMNTAAQTATFAAETKSNSQRLAEFFLKGDFSTNAIAKAMDIAAFPPGGGVTGGATYTTANPMPVKIISSSDRQAQDIPVPPKGNEGTRLRLGWLVDRQAQDIPVPPKGNEGTIGDRGPMGPKSDGTEFKGAELKVAEGDRGPMGPKSDGTEFKGAEGDRGTMGPKPGGTETKGALSLSDFKGAEEVLSLSDTMDLETMSASMSSVDGTTRKIEANSDRTPAAVSDVQSVSHATTVTAERESRGPEAGGGKSREKNEVTLAAGQSPIPVVVVSASGALAAPLTS